MKKISSLIAFMVLFTLIFSPFSLPKTVSAQNKTINEETTLIISKPLENSFENEEQIHWYKLDPSKEDIAKRTHFRIKLESEQEVNISVYSSLENALNNSTFDRYMGYSLLDLPALIDFPIAWTGPYYVKVEYYGEKPEENGTDDTDVSYTISYNGVTLPPSDQIIGEECPVELTTKEREYGKNILKDLRMIRNKLLSNTEYGKEISSLYYKMAPYITKEIILNKSKRDNVYKSLVQLKNLITDLAKNEGSSSYTITKEDQKAINDLYAIAFESVPDALKNQIETISKKVELSNLTNSTVSSILIKSELLQPNQKNYLENRYIVKLKDGKKLSSFNSKVKSFNVKSIISLNENESIFDDMFVIELDNNDKTQYKTTANLHKATVQQISKLPEIEFVEKVHQYHSLSTDRQYPYQWSLENNGKNNGVKHADIQNEPLQNLIKSKKLRDTIIAVVDTGVDHTLADLADKVHSDSGYNYIQKTSDAMDDNGHGTHVSGIIAATANNHYSMAGINRFAKILPVKVLDSTGSGDTEQIAQGIKYAADHGAKVINLSLGGPYSRVIEYALQYANKKNVTIIAASGNDGFEGLSYPASSKYVISVGATNRLDLVSDYSNYGNGLELVAPGTDIPSLVPDGNVINMSGTSMAAPHVSAVAGLMLSHNPNLKPSDVEKILTKTAKDVSFEEQDNPAIIEEFVFEDEELYPEEIAIPGYDKVSGWGRLNAFSVFSALELNANVNPILNNHSLVTGTAKSGSVVKVMNGNKELGKSKATISGKFSVKIPVQKKNKVLNVAVTNNKAKASIRVVVEKAPNKPVVNKVTNKDVYITGEAEPNLTVKIKNSSKKVIATSKVADSGAFKVKINKQKENSILYVTVSENEKESSEVKVTVRDVIPPNAPKVNSVSDKDTKIKGKAEVNATVIASVKGKKIGSAKANKKGEFLIAINKQKAGTTIRIIATDAAKNGSKAKNVKVIDRTPPSPPKVYAVNSESTLVKGKTEAFATVKVKLGKKTLGTAKANSKGEYSVKIKKQKENSTLSVSVKDQAGNNGAASKVIVKKA